MHICLFDIDGTLISSGGSGKAALEAALASEFGIDKITDNFSLSGRTDRAIVAELIQLYSLDPSPLTIHRMKEAYLRHLPTSLAGVKGCILPGIPQLLDRLRQREDVALGLLTGNTRAGAEMKLSHFGLWEYFSFGGYGDDHHDRDDVAREALREAHACLNGNVCPDRVWVLGDTPLDIRCARAIGARVVAVATGWHEKDELATHSPDLLLADLADPSPFLIHLC